MHTVRDHPVVVPRTESGCRVFDQVGKLVAGSECEGDRKKHHEGLLPAKSPEQEEGADQVRYDLDLPVGEYQPELI